MGTNGVFARTPFESMKKSGVTYFVSLEGADILRSANHGCPPFDLLTTLSPTNVYDIALDEEDHPNLVMYSLTNPTGAGQANNIKLAYGFVNENVSPATVTWKLFNPANPSPLDEKISDVVITHPFPKKKLPLFRDGSGDS